MFKYYLESQFFYFLCPIVELTKKMEFNPCSFFRGSAEDYQGRTRSIKVTRQIGRLRKPESKKDQLHEVENVEAVELTPKQRLKQWKNEVLTHCLPMSGWFYLKSGNSDFAQYHTACLELETDYFEFPEEADLLKKCTSDGLYLQIDTCGYKRYFEDKEIEGEYQIVCLMDDKEFFEVITKLSKSGCSAYFTFHHKVVDPIYKDRNLRKRLLKLIKMNQNYKWFGNNREEFYWEWVNNLK